MKCFKLLLSRDDVDINLPVMFKQYTPLMMCAIYGRVKMLDILLSKKNIDINFVTQASVYYNTAIKCACVYRRFHILTLLISRCEHTLDIYCGGNVHILSCLYKTFNDGLLFSRAELETNPYYIYIFNNKNIYIIRLLHKIIKMNGNKIFSKYLIYYLNFVATLIHIIN